MPGISRNHKKFETLRQEYPVFTYEDFQWKLQGDQLQLTFHFSLNDEYHFYPRHTYSIKDYLPIELSSKTMDSLVFHIGMVELVSYWKAACPPRVHIQPFALNEQQQQWWKKLYFQGLGEFFYLNAIEADIDDFMQFSFPTHASYVDKPFDLNLKDEIIIPVGGGKDSVVSLSLLGNVTSNATALVINQREATHACIEVAGLKSNVLEVSRSIDPVLLELNQKGFLNGHTPFSSLLAFVSLLAAAISGKKHIALSNEASANEATIPGTNINHQYSKSFEFEQDFRAYYQKYICADINYFSFLRPLNELQIGALFSENPSYFKVFKSCNVGSKIDSWCCNCPKCLFTWLMLAPFRQARELTEIFGENLLEKPSLIPQMEQLAGLSPEKPFECVGTLAEVNAALQHLCANQDAETMPVLLQHYARLQPHRDTSALAEHLRYHNPYHNLLPAFDETLKTAVERLKEKI